MTRRQIHSVPGKNPLLNEIIRGFGLVGVSEIQVGTKTIRTRKPEGCASLVGFGDSVEVGSVVSWSCSMFVDGGSAPVRIVGIFPVDDDPNDFYVHFRPLFEGPLLADTSGNTSTMARGLHEPMRFRRLSQEEVSRQFAERIDVTDGIRSAGPVYAPCKFEVRGGRPVWVRRSMSDPRAYNASNIQLMGELAGWATGFKLKLASRYSDAEKLTREVVGWAPLVAPVI